MFLCFHEIVLLSQNCFVREVKGWSDRLHNEFPKLVFVLLAIPTIKSIKLPIHGDPIISSLPRKAFIITHLIVLTTIIFRTIKSSSLCSSLSPNQSLKIHAYRRSDSGRFHEAFTATFFTWFPYAFLSGNKLKRKVKYLPAISKNKDAKLVVLPGQVSRTFPQIRNFT